MQPDGVPHVGDQSRTGRDRTLPGPRTPDARAGTAEKGDAAPKAAEVTTTTDELYQVYFHGPAYQVLARAWQTGGGVAGELSADLPSNHVPPRRR